MFAGAHQDSDPDGDALTATLAIGDRGHGSVTVGSDGSFAYSYTGTLPPPGSDTFAIGSRTASAEPRKRRRRFC